MTPQEKKILRKRLIDFMEFAINLPERPEYSTKELVVDKYINNENM